MSESPGGIAALGIDLKIFIAQLINFVIVLLVLWKWAYGPILKMLDARRDKVEASLKNADVIEKRLAALEDERKETILKAKAEAAKVLEAARADGEAMRNETVEKAKREVEGVVLQGKTQLKAEKETMLRELKEEVAALAVEAARKILADSVDEKKSKALAEAVVKKMA